MRSNELRIGNWVYNDFTREDIEVYPMMIHRLSKIEGEHHIKPIPLTEDWLIKFGFQSDNLLDEDRTPILTIDCGEHVIDFIVGYYDECEVDDLSTPCKHLHQLQNLYFALTGEEITIKE